MSVVNWFCSHIHTVQKLSFTHEQNSKISLSDFALVVTIFWSYVQKNCILFRMYPFKIELNIKYHKKVYGISLHKKKNKKLGKIFLCLTRSTLVQHYRAKIM